MRQKSFLCLTSRDPHSRSIARKALREAYIYEVKEDNNRSQEKKRKVMEEHEA